MKPEVQEQIGEWGNVYQAVRQGGIYKQGIMDFFRSDFTFAQWYHETGYGGEPEALKELILDHLRFETTGFFYFLLALDETYTTPSERI